MKLTDLKGHQCELDDSRLRLHLRYAEENTRICVRRMLEPTKFPGEAGDTWAFLVAYWQDIYDQVKERLDGKQD